MIAPNADIHLRALRGGGAGRTDERGGEDAVASVEPAVRSPAQAVHDVVADGAGVPSVEQDFGCGVGDVVAVFVGDEEQIRRARRPHAAEAEFDGSEAFRLVPEDGALVETPVVIHVFQDHDAVAELRVVIHFALRIRVALRNPEPPARIRGDRDRLLHIRLGGKHRDVKTGRRFHRGGSLVGRHWTAAGRLGVKRRGEVGGKGSRGD